MSVRSSRPRILIATSYKQNDTEPLEEIVLPAAYVEAIVQAGGLPVLVPPMDNGPAWHDLIGQGHGLLLAGGFDIDPQVYGQERHPKTVTTPLKRCRADSRLMHWADTRGLPVLGICLGMQTINVCRGGTLIQHVPDIDERMGSHLRVPGRPRNRHLVRIEAGSRLAEITGGDTVDSNTSHHQAVDLMGNNLRPVAWSEDGLVEAIEDGRAGRFVLGVQWHPEELIHERPHGALFSVLVGEAEAWRRAGGVGDPLAAASS